MNESKAIFRAAMIRLAWIYGVCLVAIGSLWLPNVMPHQSVPRPTTTVVPYRGTTPVVTYESPCDGPVVVTSGHGNPCGGG